MASGVKFQPFVAEVANKVHNLGSDQLAVALTDTAPTNTFNVLSQITEISYTNLSSRNVTTTSSTQTSGTYKLILADLVLTASGAVGPFRYVVLYNATSSGNHLIAYWDKGSEVTMANGEQFTCDFDNTNGAIQLA